MATRTDTRWPEISLFLVLQNETYIRWMTLNPDNVALLAKGFGSAELFNVGFLHDAMQSTTGASGTLSFVAQSEQAPAESHVLPHSKPLQELFGPVVILAYHLDDPNADVRQTMIPESELNQAGSSRNSSSTSASRLAIT